MHVEQTVFGVRSQLDRDEALAVLMHLHETYNSATPWEVREFMYALAAALNVDLDELDQ